VTCIVKDEFSFVLVLNVLYDAVIKKGLLLAYIKPKLVALLSFIVFGA
jgi:hypothetical protein